MNPLPPNADELVSAYLDGEAAPDEVAVVESSPALMERVEALRGVSDLLGAPLEPPAEQKEAHIGAALDAFDALFASEFTADSTETDATASAAETPRAPAPSLVAVPPVVEEPAADRSTTVTSLSDARERRRPRRFNTGVIAAAVVAVLLFVVVAAFGFGGGDRADVANTSAADTSDAVSDTVDDSFEEEAAVGSAAGSALSELAEPEPSAAAAPEARVDSANATADDDAMEDEEEAMADEEAMSDEELSASDTAELTEESAGEPASETDLALAGPLRFADVQFTDLESLLVELETLSGDELLPRVSEPGLFPGCQADVADLAAIEAPTLFGQTLVDGEPVEIHQIIADDGTTRFVIVDGGCMILSPTP